MVVKHERNAQVPIVNSISMTNHRMINGGTRMSEEYPCSPQDLGTEW